MDDEDDQEEGKKDDSCSARGERSGGRRGRWEGEKEKDVEEGTGTKTRPRATSLINSKFGDFSDYDWMPATHEDVPSIYLYELVNWLTTVVDSLTILSASSPSVFLSKSESFSRRLSPYSNRRGISRRNDVHHTMPHGAPSPRGEDGDDDGEGSETAKKG
ncbi:hypothetical protein BJV78DRAFT_1158429 [Lactifluus subvellereus]|nr:hypothetical protein BJV78DRAFT_1158429 [Lactifluus subvellereus]